MLEVNEDRPAGLYAIAPFGLAPSWGDVRIGARKVMGPGAQAKCGPEKKRAP